HRRKISAGKAADSAGASALRHSGPADAAAAADAVRRGSPGFSLLALRTSALLFGEP
nr:hypothetical protein [Tanacetum cinerariifolium]